MGSLSPATSSPPFKKSKTLSRRSYTCDLDVLEQDHVALILRHLPPRSILSFAVTCHRYRILALGDSLWRHVCAREWGAELAAEIPASLSARAGFSGLYGDVASLQYATWQRVEQGGGVPKARASQSMAVLSGGKLVVFGGGSHGGRHLDDTWLAATDKLLLPGGAIQMLTWQQAATEGQPAGRFQQSCTVIKDKIVMFGGINDFGVRSDETWLFSVTDDGGKTNCGGRSNSGLKNDDAEKNNDGGENLNRGEKDGGVSTWKQLSVLESPDARGAHAASYIGKSRIVVFGGIGNGGIRFGDTWVLDLDEDPLTWRQVVTSESPQARSGHTLTWITENRVVLFGGRGANLEVLSDVWILDFNGSNPFWFRLETAVCQDKTSFVSEGNEDNGYNGVLGPGPRAGHSATPILGGRVLIFGGEDGSRGRKCDVWVLDPNRRREEEGEVKEEEEGEGEESEECQVPELAHPKEGDLQVVPELMTEGGGEGGKEGVRMGAGAGQGRESGRKGEGERDEKMTETESSLDASVLQEGEREVVAIDFEDKGEAREGESSEIRNESMDADGKVSSPPPTTLTSAPTISVNIAPITTTASTSTPPTISDSINSQGTEASRETKRDKNFKRKGESNGERERERQSRGLWKYVECKGEVPERRSYHGACGMGGGSSVMVFGGMVDGEQQGHTAAGLTFDDQVFILQLGRT